MFAPHFQTFFNDNDTKRNFVQPDFRFHMDTNNNSSIKTFFCYFFYFSNRKEVFHFGLLVFIFVIIKVSAQHLGIESVIEKSNHELRVTKRMNWTFVIFNDLLLFLCFSFWLINKERGWDTVEGTMSARLCILASEKQLFLKTFMHQWKKYKKILKMNETKTSVYLLLTVCVMYAMSVTNALSRCNSL